MLIDSHCHINFNAYKEDGEEVIKRALANDIWIVNVGSQDSTSVRTIKIAEKYDQGVYAVVGLHPIHLNEDVTESGIIDGKRQEFTTRHEDFAYEKYKTLAQSSQKVVGLGETGLDYYYFNDELTKEEFKNNQIRVFKEFIRMGQELDLPIVVHCRGSKNDPHTAYDDLIEILKNSKISFGVIHCFGGNPKQAQDLLALGFYIGFTGMITFGKKAGEIQEVVRQVPLNRILIETDAPFLAPEPHRGERNEPLYVRFVAQKIAEIKNVGLEEVMEVTTANAKKLFKL